MNKAEIVRILKGNGTEAEKADRLVKMVDEEIERERGKARDAAVKDADAGVIRKVEVDTGDDNSNVVSHASAYGLHVGLDDKGRAREVQFNRGARITGQSTNEEQESNDSK